MICTFSIRVDVHSVWQNVWHTCHILRGKCIEKTEVWVTLYSSRGSQSHRCIFPFRSQHVLFFSPDTLNSLCSSSSSISREVCVVKKRKWQWKAPLSRSIQSWLTPSMSNIKLLFFLTAHIPAVSRAMRLERQRPWSQVCIQLSRWNKGEVSHHRLSPRAANEIISSAATSGCPEKVSPQKKTVDV